MRLFAPRCIARRFWGERSLAWKKATEALDNLQPTAVSHNRIMILEVMGRNAGHISMVAGVAGGADVILIPEIPYRIEHVVRKIETLKESGREFALIIVTESTPNESENKVV